MMKRKSLHFFKIAICVFGIFASAHADNGAFSSMILLSTGDFVEIDGNKMEIVEIRDQVLNLQGAVVYHLQVGEAGEAKEVIARFENGSLQVIAATGQRVPRFQVPDNQAVNDADWLSFSDLILATDGRIGFRAFLATNGGSVQVFKNEVVCVTGDDDEVWVIERENRIAKTPDAQGGSYQGGRQIRMGTIDFDQSGALIYKTIVATPETNFYNMVYRVKEYLDPDVALLSIDPIFVSAPFSSGDDGRPDDVETHFILGSLSGNASVTALRTGGTISELSRHSGINNIEKIISTGDTIAGLESPVRRMAVGVSPNASRPPFWAQTDAGEALLRENLTNDGLEVVAKTGAEAAGFGAGYAFESLGNPASVSGNASTFSATVRTPEGELLQTVWRKISENAALAKLASEGMEVPGQIGATFASFGPCRINQAGQVLFSARLQNAEEQNTDSPFAYFLVEPSLRMIRLIGVGDPLFISGGEKISSLQISGFSDAAEVLLCVKTDQDRFLSIKLTITPPCLPSYDQWAETFFGDTPQRGRYHDADGDGVVNVAEFFNGTNPVLALSNEIPLVISVNPDSQEVIQLEMKRFRSETDVSRVLEMSTDLVTWIPVPDIESTGDVTEVQGEREKLAVAAPFTGSSQGRTFFRFWYQ